MRAIEVTGKIDKKGVLRLDNPLIMRDRNVKVIILLAEEDEGTEEKLWLSAVANNPAFGFLHDEQENMYSLTDGKRSMTKGKIVLVPFPFDDFSGTKVRPAICWTDEIGFYNHVIVAFVSSQVPTSLEASNLQKRSLILHHLLHKSITQLK